MCCLKHSNVKFLFKKLQKTQQLKMGKQMNVKKFLPMLKYCVVEMAILEYRDQLAKMAVMALMVKKE